MNTNIINRKTRILAKELGIRSANDNARAKLFDALPSLSAMEGVEVVFESGQSVSWNNMLELPDNVHLVAEGEVSIHATGTTQFSRFLRVKEGAECRIHGNFVWDAHSLLSQVFIHASGDSTISVDGSKFLSTGADLTMQGPSGIRIGVGRDCRINEVSGDGIGDLVHWAGSGSDGPSNGRQTRTRLNNPAKVASVVKINHHTTDLTVHDVEQSAYPPDVVGGHCIALQGESSKNPEPTITGLNIDKVRLTGRRGVGWERGVANGATGDMIAIRSAKNWSVTDFVLRHGGEFGISAVHGAKDGYVGPKSGKAIIEHNDAAAVVVGGGAYRIDKDGSKILVQPAVNVSVEGIEIHDVGVDNAATPLGFSSICGIRILNTLDCRVVDNQIFGARGAPIYISNSPNFPNERIVIERNDARSCGTTDLGGDPVWYGQTPAYKWDGDKLTKKDGRGKLSKVTGLLDGNPFPSGTGGL